MEKKEDSLQCSSQSHGDHNRIPNSIMLVDVEEDPVLELLEFLDFDEIESLTEEEEKIFFGNHEATFTEMGSLKCVLCHIRYMAPSDTLSKETKKAILNICKKELYRELYDFNRIGTKTELPFCQDCLLSIQNIQRIIKEKEMYPKELKETIDEFAMMVLKARLKKRNGRFSGGFVKLEQNEDEECKVCKSSKSNPQPLPSNEIKDIVDICSTYLFDEIYDKHLTENMISSLNRSPFCNLCYDNIQQIREFAANVKANKLEHENAIKEIVLKCLISRRRLKSPPGPDDNGYLAEAETESDSDDDVTIL